MKKSDAIEAAFLVLEDAASAGRRCPENGMHGLTSSLASELARAGRILIEVYPHNFRRVTILVGLHAGKSTAACPNSNWRPYKIISKETVTSRGLFDRGAKQRTQPSAPRILSTDEIERS